MRGDAGYHWLCSTAMCVAAHGAQLIFDDLDEWLERLTERRLDGQ
jgi:hypothetical protein